MKQLINSLLLLAFLTPVSALAETVRCESNRNDLKECEMNTRGGVRMVKQLSRADCNEGVNWGVNKNSVWVKNGCSAEFESRGGGSAANVGRDWDRGCSDAKRGTYDRSNHSSAYEEGWQQCKNQNKPSGNVDKEWARGCEDAKNDYYQKSDKHGQPYDDGWRACKKQSKIEQP